MKKKTEKLSRKKIIFLAAYEIIEDLVKTLEKESPEFYYSSDLVARADNWFKLVEKEMSLKDYCKQF